MPGRCERCYWRTACGLVLAAEVVEPRGPRHQLIRPLQVLGPAGDPVLAEQPQPCRVVRTKDTWPCRACPSWSRAKPEPLCRRCGRGQRPRGPSSQLLSCYECRTAYHAACGLADPAMAEGYPAGYFRCRDCCFRLAVRRRGADSGDGRDARMLRAAKRQPPPRPEAGDEDSHCYCGGPASHAGGLLLCEQCRRLFHLACVQDVPAWLRHGLLPWQRTLRFLCANCNDGAELLQRPAPTWPDLVQLCLANLAAAAGHSAPAYHWSRHVCRWLRAAWHRLYAADCLRIGDMEQQVQRALATRPDLFLPVATATGETLYRPLAPPAWPTPPPGRQSSDACLRRLCAGAESPGGQSATTGDASPSDPGSSDSCPRGPGSSGSVSGGHGSGDSGPTGGLAAAAAAAASASPAASASEVDEERGQREERTGGRLVLVVRATGRRKRRFSVALGGARCLQRRPASPAAGEMRKSSESPAPSPASPDSSPKETSASADGGGCDGGGRRTRLATQSLKPRRFNLDAYYSDYEDFLSSDEELTVLEDTKLTPVQPEPKEEEEEEEEDEADEKVQSVEEKEAAKPMPETRPAKPQPQQPQPPPTPQASLSASDAVSFLLPPHSQWQPFRLPWEPPDRPLRAGRSLWLQVHTLLPASAAGGPPSATLAEQESQLAAACRPLSGSARRRPLGRLAARRLAPDSWHHCLCRWQR